MVDYPAFVGGVAVSTSTLGDTWCVFALSDPGSAARTQTLDVQRPASGQPGALRTRDHAIPGSSPGVGARTRSDTESPGPRAQAGTAAPSIEKDGLASKMAGIEGVCQDDRDRALITEAVQCLLRALLDASGAVITE